MNKNIKGLLVLHFLNDGVRTTFVTLLPFIAKDLSFTLTSVGFLGSAQPIFATLLALPAGFISSKLGGFHFLISLLVIYSLGALAAGFSTNLLLITLAFFLAALGFGMFHTVGFSLVAKISSKTDIGRNMGNFTSIGEIGRVSIPPVSVFLVSIFGWRMTMVSIAATGFIIYAFLQIFKPSKNPHLETSNNEHHLDFLKSILILLKTKKLLLTLLAAAIDSFASSPVYLFLPFLLFAKGINVTEYGIIITAFFIGSLFGKTVLGRGVDKFGNLKIFIFSEVLMATMLILVTLSSNFAILLMLSFLLATFTRGTTPVIQAMMSEVSHKMHYHKIYALSEMSIGISAVITIILMGIIADRVGIAFVFYTTATLALLAITPTLFLSRQKA